MGEQTMAPQLSRTNQTKLNRRHFTGGIGGLLTLGLAGCAEEDPAEEEDPEDTPDPGEIVEGGELSVGFVNPPQTYNILTPGSDDEFGLRQLSPVYDWGFAVDPRDSSYVPWAFEDWEVIPENVGTGDPAIIGELREGMTFHDGEPVTAEDPVFTQEYIREQEPGGRLTWRETIDEVGYDSADGTTVLYYFNEPDFRGIEQTIGYPILPAHFWRNIDDVFDFEPESPDEIIGSGPLEVIDWSWQEWLRLRVRPREELPQLDQDLPWIHDEAPFVDEIRFEIFEDSSTLNQALLDGTIHMPGGGQSISNALDAEESEDHTVLQTDPPDYTGLHYNLRRVPFDDIAFRQFIAKSVNQQALIDDVFMGFAAQKANYHSSPAFDEWLPPDPDVIHDDHGGVYEGVEGTVEIPDLSFPEETSSWEMSQQVVDELRDFLINHPDAIHDYSLGDAESDGVDSIDGQEIYVNGEPLGEAHTDNFGESGHGPLEYMAGPPEHGAQAYDMGTELINTWQTLGVPMAREEVPWGTMLPRIYMQNDFDMYPQPWPNNSVIHDHFEWHLSSEGICEALIERGEVDDEEPPCNTVLWNSMAYDGSDDLIYPMMDMMDPQDRMPYAKQILVQLYRDQPSTPMYHSFTLQGVHLEYAGHIDLTAEPVPRAGTGLDNTWTYINVHRNPEWTE